ncbi:MAG: ferric reductase-like transmembrane domain-containing protein [Acidimicrobiia bacterium]
MSQVTWYAARASGVVSWALILLTIVWGMLLATRVLGRRATPAWLLSLHRYLGALAVVFVGVHVGALMLDSYTPFGPVDVLVPFATSWHPLAVAWGIVGMYLLAAVEITSLLRHKLSNKVWHAIHVTSYLLFGFVTVHFVTAGTDAKAILASTAAVLVATAAAFGSAALYLWRSDPGVPVEGPVVNPRIPAAARAAASAPAPAPSAPPVPAARSLDEPVTGRLVSTGPAPVSSANGTVTAPPRSRR